MIGMDNDPIQLHFQARVGFHHEIFHDVMREQGLSSQCISIFIEKLQSLPPTQRGWLLSNRDALSDMVQKYTSCSDEWVDTFVDRTDIGGNSNSIIWCYNSTTTTSTTTTTPTTTGHYSAKWEQVVSTDDMGFVYTKLENGMTLSWESFLKEMSKGMIYLEDAMWLPKKDCIKVLQRHMWYRVERCYNQRRMKRQRRKPCVLHPRKRKQFMAYTYNKCNKHPFLKEMLVESNYGSYAWNLGCIADTMIHNNDDWYRSGRAIRVGPVCVLQYKEFWDVAFQTAYDMMECKVHKKYSVEYYQDIYQAILYKN
jgi:hypothetical protein